MLPGAYSDATLSVDAVLVHPADDQYVQIACRSQDATSPYRFAFRPTNGEVWINRWLSKSGLPQFTGLYFGRSSAVHVGGESNHLELTCKETTIEARVNGVTVTSVSDNTFASGQFWIAVGESPGGAHPEVPPEARFTQLDVIQE